MAAVKKIGAYICKGCGLDDRLDCGQLETVATREGKASPCKSHDFLCSQAGVDMIAEDIKSEELTHVVIAACSRRAKTEAFNFETVAISRANLREGVIWVRPDTDEARETTQEMADDYVRMACAEAKFTTQPPGNTEDKTACRHLLVVGGGITGMTAALEAAKAGYAATIVEKSAQLGGVVGQLSKRIATTAPFTDLPDNGVAAMAAEIAANDKITVHLNATVTRTSGAPGRFAADISTESGSTVTENFGAIVQASGFKPYDMGQLSEFNPDNADVVDQMGLEALVKEANGGAIKRPSDGKEIRSVAFIQCAGQRSQKEGHLSYCSGHCCQTSIKQAMYFKQLDSDIDAVVMFTDLRTPGAGGENFYRAGQDSGVTFTKSVASEISAGDSGPKVKFDDLLLNENVEQEFDLVVLATGMVPNSGVDIEAEAAAPAEGEAADSDVVASVPVESILNLDYRQGADVPQLVHGFTDSHFICFPYETRRTGIYTAGPVRRPMDAVQAMDDAAGAAMKAIQAIENANLGRAAHPRSGDLSYPLFRKEGCTQCKRCTVEC
ncbi:CoB--CoM heterodisulfide reductase iron-sulfur subunit A family protein, partial [Candidatus Venteria ishoeyi]|uniref:CoB--CoM heterodisulfide reductase iron-sulfur subunit A family protein n=1 Tax=Candidatus Venteria ishoeyi TaxID=1899563 RepID=UPI000AB4E373